MENELRDNLSRCATQYAEVRGIAVSTLGRLAAGDWRFFDRLNDDEKTFTARKYDEVIGWFSQNWPERTEWPPGIVRPDAARSAS